MGLDKGDLSQKTLVNFSQNASNNQNPDQPKYGQAQRHHYIKTQANPGMAQPSIAIISKPWPVQVWLSLMLALYQNLSYPSTAIIFKSWPSQLWPSPALPLFSKGLSTQVWPNHELSEVPRVHPMSTSPPQIKQMETGGLLWGVPFLNKVNQPIKSRYM